MVLTAALVAATGVVPAFAHNGPGHAPLPPLRGTVIYDSATKLQLSTSTGVVSIGLNSWTHVVRVVSGSTADLHANQIVDLRLAPGGNTVVSIRIEGMARPPHSGTTKHHDFDAEPALIRLAGANVHQQGTPASQPNHIHGQVVSAGSSSITIRTHSGKSTYTISNSVTVTKLVTGSLNDLAVGEMVSVFRGRDGSAHVITIMSA